MPKIKTVADIKENDIYVMQSGSNIYIKAADMAVLLGKSLQWIGQLTTQGTISKIKTPHGQMYLLKDAIPTYCKMLESRANDKDEEFESSEKTKLKSEAELKKAKATIATLDAKERLGKMHRSEDVAAMTEDLIFAVRGALLALPGRLAADIVSVKSSAEASELIRKEIYKIMSELSEYQYDSSKYEERVRERLRLSSLETEDEEN